MTRSYRMDLDISKRTTFDVTVEFFKNRLQTKEAIDWALRLESKEKAQRLAILHLINRIGFANLDEPWLTAWHLIEEYWSYPEIEHGSAFEIQTVKRLLTAGSRTGIDKIIDFVAPRMQAKPIPATASTNRHKHPKKVEDLVSIKLTSGTLSENDFVKLCNLFKGYMLETLASNLDNAILNALEIAKRLRWNDNHLSWRFGDLYRVYYVPPKMRQRGEREPDELHRGIALSVKLLYFAIDNLITSNLPLALEFLNRWKTTPSPIYLRLWAALSRNRQVTSCDEVCTLLHSLDDIAFWHIQLYPEIAELRALRFGEFGATDQNRILRRIMKRPPRRIWRKADDNPQVESARDYWAARELLRIEIAGNALSKEQKDWIEKQKRDDPDLEQMRNVYFGFPSGFVVRTISHGPDTKYDRISGEVRLKVLENVFASSSFGWENDPASRAHSWLKEKNNIYEILADFESITNAGAAYPMTWNQFGMDNSPPQNIAKDLTTAKRVLSLLCKLPDSTLSKAIDGLSHWLSQWKQQVINAANGFDVWHKLWPIAVSATDKRADEKAALLPCVLMDSRGSTAATNVDTLNTPVGRLIDVFFCACPSVKQGDKPFAQNTSLCAMRDTIEQALGPSGSNVKSRLIEEIGYFLFTDHSWAQKHLISALRKDDSNTLIFWRALARKTRGNSVLKIVGKEMAKYAVDQRLDCNSQHMFVGNLIVECLHAFLEKRKPAVPHSHIQQMLRLIDDESRSYGASIVSRFLRENTDDADQNHPVYLAEEIYQKAVKPFLQNVWPQERSLVTQGVSEALANVPSNVGNAFADAVDTISRFLVPFECWDLMAFGFLETSKKRSHLSSVKSPKDAEAFLKLLHLSIAVSDKAVVPHNLGDALLRIQAISPALAKRKEFRRLLVASRGH